MRKRRRIQQRRWTRVRAEYGDVVLDELRGTYWHLNPTAVLALDTFETGGSVDDVVERFVETFGVDPETAQEDVTALAVSLRKAGML